MVEHVLAKDETRVRFPLPAPTQNGPNKGHFVLVRETPEDSGFQGESKAGAMSPSGDGRGGVAAEESDGEPRAVTDSRYPHTPVSTKAPERAFVLR